MRITPVDDEKARDGTWISYMGVPLKIARAGNEKFKNVFRRLSKPYQREIENGSLDERAAEDILCKALAQAVLLDWDAEKFPGKVPYSTEDAEALLKDDPDCRTFVTEFSQRAENYFLEERETRLGN